MTRSVRTATRGSPIAVASVNRGRRRHAPRGTRASSRRRSPRARPRRAAPATTARGARQPRAELRVGHAEADRGPHPEAEQVRVAVGARADAGHRVEGQPGADRQPGVATARAQLEPPHHLQPGDQPERREGRRRRAEGDEPGPVNRRGEEVGHRGRREDQHRPQPAAEPAPDRRDEDERGHHVAREVQQIRVKGERRDRAPPGSPADQLGGRRAGVEPARATVATGRSRGTSRRSRSRRARRAGSVPGRGRGAEPRAPPPRRTPRAPRRRAPRRRRRPPARSGRPARRPGARCRRPPAPAPSRRPASQTRVVRSTRSSRPAALGASPMRRAYSMNRRDVLDPCFRRR